MTQPTTPTTYRYFVSFHFTSTAGVQSFGNIDVTRTQQINNQTDVNGIQTYLIEQIGTQTGSRIQSLTVLSFSRWTGK